MNIFDKTILKAILPKAPIVLDVGCYDGKDGLEIHRLFDYQGELHSFDPCSFTLFKGHKTKNVFFYDCALSNKNGSIPIYNSAHSQSNSIRKPKEHLKVWPDVKFKNHSEAKCCKLDTIWPNEKIDFIWADLNGSEGDFVRGAIKTLKNTQYLYIEFSDKELYEGQVNKKELLRMLPGWKVMGEFNVGENFGNIFLKNTKV